MKTSQQKQVSRQLAAYLGRYKTARDAVDALIKDTGLTEAYILKAVRR